MGEERSEPHVPMIVPAEGDSSTVPRFASAGLNLAAVVAAFEEHGAVIVERGEEYTAGMHAQLQEHWAEAEEDEEDGGEGFYPGNTKRTVGLVTRAPAVHPLILDEVGLGICDGHLLPNCDEYQLNLTAGLSVGPGARQQELHREDDLWPFFPVPRPACAVASLTALSDFTVQTGATVSLRPSLALAGFPQLTARRGLSAASRARQPPVGGGAASATARGGAGGHARRLHRLLGWGGAARSRRQHPLGRVATERLRELRTRLAAYGP